jgi:hypothetical protein
MSDGTKFLYRGVHARHPALADARKGIVRPGSPDGTISAREHNSGGLSALSPYTSWTRKLNFAQLHASQHGPGGIVLRVALGGPPPEATWKWVYSDDAYGEDEVLLRGIRLDVEVMEP